MFTGLIEEVGKIIDSSPLGKGLRLKISAKEILGNLSIGDSININGACQTVTEFNKNSFTVIAVEETVKKTNFGKLKINQPVNLESSLTLNKKLGGHFVMGHVDTTGVISKIEKISTSYLISIDFPGGFNKFVIHVGSIAVDGISLTIADFTENTLIVSIIPHTWNHTALKDKSKGDEVNLEFDILGKYVDKILNKNKNSGITEDWLRNIGFIDEKS